MQKYGCTVGNSCYGGKKIYIHQYPLYYSELPHKTQTNKYYIELSNENPKNFLERNKHLLPELDVFSISYVNFNKHYNLWNEILNIIKLYSCLKELEFNYCEGFTNNMLLELLNTLKSNLNLEIKCIIVRNNTHFSQDIVNQFKFAFPAIDGKDRIIFADKNNIKY